MLASTVVNCKLISIYIRLMSSQASMLIDFLFSSNLLKLRLTPPKPVTLISAGSYVNYFFGTLPGLSLTSLLWKGLGWLNCFLYWVLAWSVWQFFSVAQLVASHNVEFITYPEQLLNRACLGPFKFVLSVTLSWNLSVLSVENSYYGSLDLKTELGCLFGLIKLALKVVSFGGYFEWFAGWVNGSVFVPYLLDVAFKVSSVYGMWTPLNLFAK